MMQAYTIETSLGYGDEPLAHIVLLQWHTVLNNYDPLLAEVRTKRAAFFEVFSNWLIEETAGHTKLPVVVTPELATPIELIEQIDQLVTTIGRPMIFIAGLEFMDWQQYEKLVNESNLPDPPSWLEGGNPELKVNAAMIWVVDAEGELHKYVQPKHHPTLDEEGIIYESNKVLLFTSVDQRANKRCNFCVQICSDFNNADQVTALREACVEAAVVNLDFTFVLQWQDDPPTQFFTQAVGSYFSPANNKIETDRGCLLFVNCANEICGKSDKWGQSALHFHYEKRWRPRHAPNTCYLSNQDALSFQAAILREAGPAVYAFDYKSHSLASMAPNSGQSSPFVEDSGRCCPIPDEVFDPSKFARIVPERDWLDKEWALGQSEWIEGISDNDEVKTMLEELWKSTHSNWIQHLDGQVLRARYLTNRLFQGIKKEGYPLKQITTKTGDIKVGSVEPMDWGQQAEQGAQRMMAVLALLARGDSEDNVVPRVTRVQHAGRSGDLSLTLMWGEGTVKSRNLVIEFVSNLSTLGANEMLSRKIVLILLQPTGVVDTGPLTRMLEVAVKHITDAHAEEDPDLPSPPGDVVNATADAKHFCLSDISVINDVTDATSIEEFDTGLAASLQVTLS